MAAKGQPSATMDNPLTFHLPSSCPTAVRGKIERGEMQKMAIHIVYRMGSLVEEPGRKTRKDVL
jgi:hypothetical protein